LFRRPFAVYPESSPITESDRLGALLSRGQYDKKKAASKLEAYAYFQNIQRRMAMKIKMLVACLALAAIISGCAVDPALKGSYMKNYDSALAATDPASVAPPAPGSVIEAQALERFRNFYKVFAASVIEAQIAELYAPAAYFRDGFREVQGLENMRAYFLSSTDTFEECAFDIQDVAVHNGNYYFRWIMQVRLKRNPTETLRLVGMSHVRFNAQGQVTFHQDYWDTSVVYEEAPVLGRVITWIRNRI